MPTLPHPGPAAFTGFRPGAPLSTPAGACLRVTADAVSRPWCKALSETILKTISTPSAPAVRHSASQGSAR
jgi:hypothetical protein